MKRQPPTTLLWKLRRRIVTQLDAAPVEKRVGLRAALRGVDTILRAIFENRQGARNHSRN
jgi:hypothetical protein